MSRFIYLSDASAGSFFLIFTTYRGPGCRSRGFFHPERSGYIPTTISDRLGHLGALRTKKNWFFFSEIDLTKRSPSQIAQGSAVRSSHSTKVAECPEAAFGSFFRTLSSSQATVAQSSRCMPGRLACPEWAQLPTTCKETRFVRFGTVASETLGFIGGLLVG